jgi:2-C-methyl-D-erythritol 4-phosphate cytidylyltransferase
MVMAPTRDVVVLVPAGGIGARLGRRTPKQFLSLGREPILTATLRHFRRHPRVARIVVAAPAAHVELARRVVGRGPGAPTVVAGGASRQQSVWHALQAAPPAADIVLVHDAVRPFLTRALIDTLIAAAERDGAAVCALPVTETVKRVRAGLVEATIERDGLWTVQTPQAFRGAVLREAHDKARRDGFLGTDDAMLVERLGHPVRVVAGLPENVKITTPEDLRRARRRAR